MANIGDSPAGTGNTSSEVVSAVDVLILANPQVPSSAGLRISRSHSVNAIDSERRKPRWMRRSLPPVKRERRRENTKPSEADATPKENPTIEPPRQRSKSMKTTTASPTNICARSLSFASSSYVVKVRQAHDETDGEHGVHGFRQLLRKTSNPIYGTCCSADTRDQVEKMDGCNFLPGSSDVGVFARIYHHV